VLRRHAHPPRWTKGKGSVKGEKGNAGQGDLFKYFPVCSNQASKGGRNNAQKTKGIGTTHKGRGSSIGSGAWTEAANTETARSTTFTYKHVFFGSFISSYRTFDSGAAFGAAECSRWLRSHTTSGFRLSGLYYGRNWRERQGKNRISYLVNRISQ
jgi:hypothetical protein